MKRFEQKLERWLTLAGLLIRIVLWMLVALVSLVFTVASIWFALSLLF